MSHGASNLENLVSGDVTVVLDVLGLLSVSEGLLELLNDERSGVGNNFRDGLSVLDGQLSSNSDTLPVQRGLLDVFTDLLGGHTEGTDLGGQDG